MQLSQHAETVAIVVSNRTFITGAATTGASVVAERSGIASMITATGPEIVNLCAMIGAVATVLGVIASIYFQILKHRRETRESEWRMSGAADRREAQRE